APAPAQAEKPSKSAKTKEKLEGSVHAGVMYLRQTLRSGQSVSHQGHLVIIGDVNPGAEVVAEGDITVWGALRGIARAGVGGNNDAEIRALRLQPIQIRIGESFARSPDKNRLHYDNHHGPETARVVDGKIKVFKFNPQF
ncbi:MAG TPA: septum site-determining protein MinC, partial [Candidatus Melainabacteria bacterium]|nr:septum site-determining protein MinC [Candidatus Melainabacteria bacterium]